MLLAFALVACGATAPVQEMSDARQAIQVAIEAGAKESASEPLLDAENFLASAEKYLASNDYTNAREDAKLAKERALAALAQAEQSSAPE